MIYKDINKPKEKNCFKVIKEVMISNGTAYKILEINEVTKKIFKKGVKPPYKNDPHYCDVWIEDDWMESVSNYYVKVKRVEYIKEEFNECTFVLTKKEMNNLFY